MKNDKQTSHLKNKVGAYADVVFLNEEEEFEKMREKGITPKNNLSLKDDKSKEEIRAEKELWDAFDSALMSIDRIEKMRAYSDEIVKSCNCFLRFLSSGLNDSDSKVSLNDAKIVVKKQNRFLNEVTFSLRNIYARIHEALYVSTYVSDHINEIFADSFCDWAVNVAVVDGVLIVQTPPLLNRLGSIIRNGKRFIASDYSMFFSVEVRKKLDEIEAQVPDYLYKTITILNVYSPSRKAIPDANNVDTKAVIDAITCRFPGLDSADYCTFSEGSIRSESAPEGTYFAVTEGLWNGLKPDEILHFIPKFDNNYVVE